MAFETSDTGAVETAYREQFGHLHHINQIALCVFALSTILSVVLIVFTDIVTFDNQLHKAGVFLLMLIAVPNN